jgi:hypothetical protein
VTTQEQRDQARENANMVRLAHANLKRDVARNPMTLLLLLHATDLAPHVASCRVYPLVKAVPGVGPDRANKAFNRADVLASKRLGDLTQGQRQRLLTAIEAFPVLRDRMETAA